LAPIPENEANYGPSEAFSVRLAAGFTSWGRHGFDVGAEARGADRGARGPRKNGQIDSCKRQLRFRCLIKSARLL